MTSANGNRKGSWTQYLISLLVRFQVILLFTIPISLLFLGCGDSGGKEATYNGANKTGMAQATIIIKWPKRSATGLAPRLIPVASNSIVVNIDSSTTQVATQTVSRPTDGTDTSTLTFHALPLGMLTVMASAYPDASGSGVAQAAGSGPMTTTNSATATATITMNSTIHDISIDPGNPVVEVGSSLALTADCADSNGNIVVVSPQTLSWQSSDATIVTVDGNGSASGIAAGQATVTLTETESGKSVTQTITVSPAGGTITGNVTDQNGNPLAGINVITSGGSFNITGMTATDGTYTLNNVPAGDRVVTFYGQGEQTTEETTVALGETSTVNAILQTSDSEVTGLPMISLNTPAVNDPAAQAIVSGKITNLDSSDAVLIVNQSEFEFSVNSDGTFSTVANLRHGLNQVYVQATNANGTTTSPVITINISGTNSIVSSWAWVLVSGSAIPTGTIVMNTDGTYLVLDSGDMGTYTFSNGLLTFDTGVQYNVSFISSQEMLWTNTDSSDGRVYDLTVNGPSANLHRKMTVTPSNAHAGTKFIDQR